MRRIIALDIGSKRIGIAVSDPFCTYALPLSTYNRKNLKTDIESIKNVVVSENATEVVCGLPLNYDGTESSQTEYTRFFIEELKKVLTIPVCTADERCTSIEAHEDLKKSGKKSDKHKPYVDSLAASHILSSYLGAKNQK